ncbi:hypothetical protein Syun_000599 [Stephania yunnanensis]|uniref:Homeobox-leucine zipper protein n=1 Tax=Stephania yunnanensis TaxID=152371 RepID=A0AAP0Q6X5_9MAGN
MAHWNGSFRPYGGAQAAVQFHNLKSIYDHDFDATTIREEVLRDLIVAQAIAVVQKPATTLVTQSDSNDSINVYNNNSSSNNGSNSNNWNNNHLERKRRMTNEQLDSLERSFQEEIKLEPERKIKLARELGLQPRQVAVWFQNRRARWKTKQLEHLYDALKQEFIVISRENQKLHEEVLKLKAKLEDQVSANQGSMGTYTEASNDETVESKSAVNRSSGNKLQQGNNYFDRCQIANCNYLINVEDHAMPTPPYWGGLPAYP